MDRVVRDHEAKIQKEKEERAALEKQLAAMQSQIVSTSADDERVAELEEQKKAARAKIEEQLAEEHEVRERMKNVDDDHFNMEEEFSSLQEELSAKTKKLKKLWTRYDTMRVDLKDQNEMNQRERDDLLAIIREQDRDLKLKMLVVASFIPEVYLQQLHDNAAYDEEQQQWAIKNQQLGGCNSERKHDKVEKKPRQSTINRSPTSAEEQEYLEAFKAMGENDEVALELQGGVFRVYPGAGALSERDEKKKKRPASSANRAKSKSSI